MKYCPACKENYPDSARICVRDSQFLSLPDPYQLVGRTLLERYRIEALVGIGGMGAVYSAHHLTINRRIALKILLPNLALGNEKLLYLFQREAEMAGQLSHDNIVDITDAGRTPDGLAYIVMEWLEGYTLDEEMQRSQQMRVERVAGILRQVAAALDHAHAHHIIHRDLKPTNIMLVRRPDGREQAKVVDFGIAKAASESDASFVTSLIGTPHYASPEQFVLGKQIDGRSDIYSLGVLLYQMLSGNLPFNALAPQELIKLHRTESPPPIRQYREDVPVAVEQLIFRMLAKEPDQRPQSAAEVASVFVRSVRVTDDRLATLPDNAMPTMVDSPVDTDDLVDDVDTAKKLTAITDERLIDRTAHRSPPTDLPPTPKPQESRVEGGMIQSPAPDQQKLKKYAIFAAVVLAIIAGLGALADKVGLLGPSGQPVRAELMSYYLEISSDGCQTLVRGTGDESLSSKQSFRFHFKPLQSGYLYLISQNEKNVPTTFLTAQPDPETGVKTNFVEAGGDYSFPSGEGRCLGITESERLMAFTVIFSPTLLATPSFLAAPAMRELNATEQHEFNLWHQQHVTDAPQITPDAKLQLSSVSVSREPASAGKPVIFDLPIKRR